MDACQQINCFLGGFMNVATRIYCFLDAFLRAE
jgi:hypothetical protein